MHQNNPKIWLKIALFNLCIVAMLGVIMRSKMVFDMPWVDYNRLVDTHGNFAFSGWLTLALLTLLLSQLPDNIGHRPVYSWLLGGIVLCSWGSLLTGPFAKTHSIAQYVSFLYILITYIFSWIFIRDTRKANHDKAVRLLSVSAILCLVTSSIGPIMLAYLFATKSLNGILYRDAMFGYLHMMYNGFFTLSVFAIAFNRIDKRLSDRSRKTAYRFSLLLCLSVIPSMFITFLWHDTNTVFHIITIIGCVLLLLSALWFLITAREIMHTYTSIRWAIRIIVFFSMLSFLIKLILQSLTIIHSVNVLVFGNRPAIMGFLHMVFLAFVSLFVLAYLAQTRFLDINKTFTRLALYFFIVAIIFNETLLLAQGLGAMLMAGSKSFNLYLWIAGIMLSTGASMIGLSKRLAGITETRQ